MTITVVALLGGICFMAAILVAVSMFRTPLPHLAHTLTAVRDEAVGAQLGLNADLISGNQDEGLVERCGTWIRRTARLSPSERSMAQLRLRGISVNRFYGERVASALLCAAMTIMLAAAAAAVGVGVGWSVPTGVALAAGVFGWFLPALRIASGASAVNEDALESLLVYIDLVILARQANRYARDALTDAARLSDNHLFRQIRMALARAEMEREEPWTELRRLADRLDLPQLADIADIAALQEQGASLTAALRARVTELRNAYVVRRQRDADRITQRMEIPKMLPVAVVAFILIVPTLLRIAA